jgi:phosphoglucosamine mutase
VTALQLAAIVKRTGKPLSELARVMAHYPQILNNVHVADKGLLSGSGALAEAIAEAESELGGSGRVLVRASGTEPLVRVMVEAADGNQARAVADRLSAVVKQELG